MEKAFFEAETAGLPWGMIPMMCNTCMFMEENFKKKTIPYFHAHVPHSPLSPNFANVNC